jgi:hypothetical protein
MPDVSSRTRALAVCGITDIEDYAVPERDEWFMSGFNLSILLLRNALVAKQLWFGSCEPKDLVKKCTRYSHSNLFRERQVVLDKYALEAIYEPETLRVPASLSCYS